MLLQPTHCLGQFDQKVRSVLGTRPASAQGNRPRGYRACGPSGAVPGAANVEQDARVRTPDLCPHRIKPRRGWGHCVGAQGSGGDGNLGRLGLVSARSKRITDHAFVPADRRHDLGPKIGTAGFLPPHGTAFRDGPHDPKTCDSPAPTQRDRLSSSAVAYRGNGRVPGFSGGPTVDATRHPRTCDSP